MKKFINFYLLIIFSLTSAAQGNDGRYEKDFLSADFFRQNRSELRSQMPDSSVAIFFSAPVRNRAADVDYPYHQGPYFYYLTGFKEANSLLLIFKSPVSITGKNVDELLFIPKADKKYETWNGKLATADEGSSISGISNINYTTAFKSVDLKATDFAKVLYLSLPPGLTDDKDDSCDLYDLVEQFKVKFSFPSDNSDNYLLGKILRKMREVKKPEEIKLMRKAISISCEGHKEMMRATNPGMSEYQVQSIGEYVFRKSGAEDIGYGSICGSGENSCILHYETNRRTFKSGDLILLDMGAEYHGYTADVTRTFPVNGTFSPEQKIIYDLVFKAQDSAFSQCKPGNNFSDPHKAAAEIIKKGLLDLGITKEAEDYKTYFMHGTSHYLGLDVHDAGTRNKLTEGNVFTVEPGIYIRENSNCDPKWWNIGVRIEDDVVITKNGYENLSSSCPTKAAEVEKLMKENPQFVQPFK